MLRVAGLVVIISGFVTLVMMVLGPNLISIIVKSYKRSSITLSWTSSGLRERCHSLIHHQGRVNVSLTALERKSCINATILGIYHDLVVYRVKSIHRDRIYSSGNKEMF